MNGSLQTLQIIIDKGIINVDDFYSITLQTNAQVNLQGEYNAKLIRRLTLVYAVEFNLDQNGYTEGRMCIDGDHLPTEVQGTVVRFTFT